jgi:hypothetical protein
MTTDAEARDFLTDNFRRILIELPPTKISSAMMEFEKWLDVKQGEGAHLADLTLSDPEVLGIINRAY